MNPRPILFADIQLARRIEGGHIGATVACAEAAARMFPNSGATSEAIAGGHAAFTGAGSPINQAAGLGLHEPVTDDDLDRLEAFFRQRGCTVKIELCPFADQSLIDKLGRRDYHLSEMENVLVCPLPRHGDGPTPSGDVRISKAGTADADTFARMLGQGFAEGQEPPPEMLRIGQLLFQAPRAVGFFAHVGGEAAGGGVSFFRDRVATTNGAATLPKFRGRGVQTALLLARLAHAQAAGCDLASTTTRAGTTSQRNAERCGFRVIYTRIALVKEWR